MQQFPRTTVGGVSVSRMVIGTNWFLGYSHTSAAKDRFIKSFQTVQNVAEILSVFFRHGIDTLIGMPVPLLRDAIREAEDRTGRKAVLILTPHFKVCERGPGEDEPEVVFDRCRQLGATFCMPHQCVTDILIDLLHRRIRDIDRITALIRERDMIPGLSTHMPETVRVADESGVDTATYVQIYNAAGFMMHLEVDWSMRIIRNAKQPVLTIKPMAAGRLEPVVGLGFAWNTIREQDMVAIGTTTPDEAREVVDLSLDLLARRMPDNELQRTRSKGTLD